MRIPVIADGKGQNYFSALRRLIHFVDNESDHEFNNKLFKIRTIKEAMRKEAVQFDPVGFPVN